MFNRKDKRKPEIVEPAPAEGTVMPEGTRVSAEVDPYNLRRFVDAQNHIFEEICSELREGRKTGLWLPFIFPQIKDPDRDRPAGKFAISSREEAVAYLKHRVLGPRLRRCCLILTLVTERPIGQILGHPDDLKFQRSMTLFAQVTSTNQIFMEVLRKYFGNEFDRPTLTQLNLLQAGKTQGE